MRFLFISLLLATALPAVQIAYDNTLTQDPGLASVPFGPNSSVQDPNNPMLSVVVDLLGDQIQLNPSPTGWLNGYQATTSIYNIGTPGTDDFTGVLRLHLFNVSGVTLGLLIGTFDTAALTIGAGGANSTLVTWNLNNVPLSLDMVWLVEVVSNTSPGMPLLSLDIFTDFKPVGASSDSFYWWKLNPYATTSVSSGLGNDSFYFQVTTVPEPTTGGMLALALGAWAFHKRRSAAKRRL